MAYQYIQNAAHDVDTSVYYIRNVLIERLFSLLECSSTIYVCTSFDTELFTKMVTLKKIPRIALFILFTFQGNWLTLFSYFSLTFLHNLRIIYSRKKLLVGCQLQLQVATKFSAQYDWIDPLECLRPIVNEHEACQKSSTSSDCIILSRNKNKNSSTNNLISCWDDLYKCQSFGDIDTCPNDLTNKLIGTAIIQQ